MLRFLLLLLVLAVPAFAVEPDEILDDPVMEERAREISKGLRCLVCQNENIDDSNADLARDLRLLVRERLVAGDTDQEVEDYVVDRYGEFILLKPKFSLRNAILWFTGPILFLIGGAGVIGFIRRRSRAEKPDDGLSDEERDRLASLIGD